MFFESYYDLTSQLRLNLTMAYPYQLASTLAGGNKIDYNDDAMLKAQGRNRTQTCSILRWLDIDCRPSWHRQLV